jgi:uncharacterized protein (DUF58 family)
MNQPFSLRSDAEALAGPLPALLADAEHLASTVLLGDHGRRRAGMGDTFWQYRTAQPHDTARSIDWRRSARSDADFVQDKEWQVAQTVLFWIDQSASMSFSSESVPEKAAVARLIGLASAILLGRAGERIGLLDSEMPPRRGEHALQHMAQTLFKEAASDYGVPSTKGLNSPSRAVFISDFLGDLKAFEHSLMTAADRGVSGVILQILDPQEESFPFAGRTVFESMSGTLQHETLKAGDLRNRYLDRLAERKERLASLVRLTGWQFHTHHTDRAHTSALLWLYQALDRRN